MGTHANICTHARTHAHTQLKCCHSSTEKQAYIVEIEESQLAMSPDASGSSCDEGDELLPDHGVSSSAQLPMNPSSGVLVTDASGLLKQADHVDIERVATIHAELNNPPAVTYNHCNEPYNMPTAVMATTNTMTSPQNLIGTYTPPQPLLPMLQQEPQQLLPMMYQPPQLAEQHQPLPSQLRQQFPPSISGYPALPGFPPVSNFLQPHPPRMPSAHNLSGAAGMFRMQWH